MIFIFCMMIYVVVVSVLVEVIDEVVRLISVYFMVKLCSMLK